MEHMGNLFALIQKHGYLLISAIVFAEAIGLPVPAAIALVGGGAAVAAKLLNGPTLFAIAVSGMLLGDVLLFFLGRYMGWTLLGVLCRLSMNPEACILNSAESFYRRVKMKPLQFLRFDTAGAVLYVLAYGTLGYVGRDFLKKISNGFRTAGHAVTDVLLVAFVVYIVYRFWLYYKNREYRVVPRIQVQELAKKLSAEGDKVVIVDVRSHGYYDAGGQRIKGSMRIEPNNLEEELKHLSKDKEIYLYCT